MTDSSIQVFENAEFGAIRTMTKDGEPWFVAKDVCDALGIRSDTVRAIVDSDDVAETNPNTIGVAGGRSPLIINEAGFYTLVLKSRKPEAKAFQRWVTHEVLPAIRQRGVYMADRADETPEELMARALEEAGRVLARRDERIKLLEADNATMKPKALFADAVAESGKMMLIGEFAKILRQNGVEMGQNRLFAWMRENGYLMKTGSRYNLPSQRSMEMELFRVKETVITHGDGHISTNFTTKLTPKGQMYFTQKFLAEQKEAI